MRRLMNFSINFRAEDYLDKSAPIPEIDKYHSAVVTPLVRPSDYCYCRAYFFFGYLSACMCSHVDSRLLYL